MTSKSTDVFLEVLLLRIYRKRKLKLVASVEWLEWR